MRAKYMYASTRVSFLVLPEERQVTTRSLLHTQNLRFQTKRMLYPSLTLERATQDGRIFSKNMSVKLSSVPSVFRFWVVVD